MPKEYLNETVITRPRSREHQQFVHDTTFSAGKCVPLFCQPVIAGESYQLDTVLDVRMLPLVSCPISTAKVSFWYFWVPFRIIWDDFKFNRGELPDNYTPQQQSYPFPICSFPANGGFSEGSVADYFRIPTKVSPTNVDVNACYFRGFAFVYNEYFRDEFIQPKIFFRTDSTAVTGAQTGGNYVQTCARGGDLPPLARPHDLFGSATPFPQLSSPEPLPITGSAPVWSVPTSVYPLSYGSEAMQFRALANGSFPLSSGELGADMNGNNGTANVYAAAPSGAKFAGISPANLRAIFGTSSSSITTTINDLRVSIALQHLKERQMFSGTRYHEILRSMYGVENPDPIMDIPVYIGGFTEDINFDPVVQSSETASTPQGNVAGYSHTGAMDRSMFWQSLEDGFILGIAGVRNQKTYQNGLDRMYSISDEIDWYNPAFEGLGNMSILNKEIFLQDGQNESKNDEVFGYQEAFYWFHDRPNGVTGQLRSNATNSLRFWTFADEYSSLPVLGNAWMSDNSATNINRVLAAQAPTYDQFICRLTVDMTITSIMPSHMTPGLNRI